MPAGVPADHPRARWLLHTGLHVFAPPIAQEVAQTPALVAVAIAAFAAMAPVEQWLEQVLA